MTLTKERQRLPIQVYEVRPHKDERGVDLISDVLPFGRLWYDTQDHAVGYAMQSSRSHNAVIRIYDDAGNVIRNARTQGRFQRVVTATGRLLRAWCHSRQTTKLVERANRDQFEAHEMGLA